MNPLIPAFEQNIVINSKASLANVTYKSVTEAIHTIALRALKNCLENKSTYFVIQDHKNRTDFLTALRAVGIDDFSMTIHMNQSVKEADLQNLREKYDIKNSNPDTQNHSNYLYYTLQQKLKLHHQNIHSKKIFKNLTWANLLADYLSLVDLRRVSIFNDPGAGLHLDFSESEYNLIEEAITEALFIYQSDFELNHPEIKKNTLLHFYPDQFENLSEVSYKINEFKEEACILAEKYIDFISHTAHLHTKSIFQYLTHVQEKLNLLMYKFTSFGDKNDNHRTYFSGLFASSKSKNEKSFIAEINTLIDDLKEKGFLNKTYHRIQTTEEVIPKLNAISSEIVSHQQNSVSLTNEFIKSVNKLNYLDPVCENLERQLSDLLTKLNNTSLFAEKFELNTLSTIKQHEYIEAIINKLVIMLLSIEKNMDYYKWLAFINKIDNKSRSIIQQLKCYDPAVWHDIFKIWYTKRVLENNFPYTKVDSETAETIEKFVVDKEIHNIATFKNAVYASLESKISLMKKNNPEFYNAVIKKKPLKNPILWKHFFTTHIENIIEISPIIIADSDEMINLKNHAIDEIIYLDFKAFDINIMQAFKSVFYFFDEEHFDAIPDYLLKRENLPKHQTLQNIHTTGKITLVRNITHELTQFEKNPAVFRLRDTTIISFCADYYNDRLNHHFYDKGIKQLFSDDIKNTIIGALLDDSGHFYIMIEDGLFTHDIEKFDYLQQIMVAEYMNQIGCEVINIDNKAIFRSNGDALLQLFSQVKYDDHHFSKGQNQLSIEFI